MNRLFAIFSKNSFGAFVFASIISLPSFNASSDDDVTVSYNYNMSDKLDVDYQVDMHTPHLMGDVFNISNGTMQLQNVDIDIPGNSALKVQLRRMKELVRSNSEYSILNSTGLIIGNGSWYFDTPRLTYDIAQDPKYRPRAFRDGKYCSGNFEVDNVLWGESIPLRPKDYNTGYELIIPGESGSSLIRNTGAIAGAETSEYVTKNMWKVSCIIVDGNEAFSAVNPSGVTYTFDIRKESGIVGEFAGSHKKISLVFFASKIEDRFGNWVKYDYQSGELKSISSNDGRKVDIVKTSDGAEATAHGRVWRYKDHGEKVELPDGRYWSYSYPSVNPIDGTSSTSEDFIRTTIGGTRSSSPIALRSCGIGIHISPTGGIPNGLSPYTSLIGNSYLDGFPYTEAGQESQYIEVHHPDGATGKFWLGLSLQGRTNVDPEIYYVHKASHITTPRCYLQPSLMKKSIEYRDGEVYEWHYQYSNSWGTYVPNIFFSNNMMQRDRLRALLEPSTYLPDGIDNYNHKVLKVINPDGSYVHHYINRDYQSHLENKVVNTTYFDNLSNVLQEISTDYLPGSVWGTEPAGLEFKKTRQKFEFSVPVLSKVETARYDSSGNKALYLKEYSNFNVYDQPTISHHHNSFSSKQKYYKFSYFNDTSNWDLNQLNWIGLSSSNSNYVRVKETTYHSPTSAYRGLPNCHISSGQMIYCNTSYWTGNSFAGSPRRVTMNASNRWVEYNDYKRGIPQTLAKPNSISTTPKYAFNEVNDRGWITRFTDYEGHCTNFGYNDRGLKTLIDPCDNKWANTTISYSTTTSSENLSFIEVGMFKQSVKRSNYRKTTYFDYMLRPVLVKEWDLDKRSTTSRYFRTNFDHNNLVLYRSLPHSSSSTPYGIATIYDALGRPLNIDDNTIPGSLSFTYLSDNRIHRNDNLGNNTTVSYLSYGSPNYQNATQILSPESVVTDIEHNIFDNVTSITQGSITENRVYDSRQLLCKTVRPDVGNTSYYFNSLGELQWQASGNSISDTKTACDNNVRASQKVVFNYDNLGNIRKVNYGDSSEDKTFSYDRNGNVKKIIAGTVVNSYEYNTANLLERETVNIDGQTFTLKYKYNSLAHVDLITYPNNEFVEYLPNGLGQPTIAGGYVFDAKYHPNGKVHEFTYGNGFVHNTKLYASGLTKDIYDIKGFNYAIDRRHSFDANGNLKSLRDDQNSVYNLSVDYDGLGRLATIYDSHRGTGKLEYDAQGNIKHYKLGDRDLTYTYGNKGRLDSISGALDYKFSYDDRGNVTDNGRGQLLNFNLAQQVSATSSNGLSVSFLHDGNDKRVVKMVDGKKYYFIYGLNGKLLHKRQDGVPVNQIYLGNRLVAENINNTPPPKQKLDTVTEIEPPIGEPKPPVVGPGLPVPVNPEW